MSDDEQGRGPLFHAFQRPPQVLGIEGGEALVQDHEAGVLEQGARQKQAAALAVGELPAGFSHHLLHAARHAFQQTIESQLPAQRLDPCQAKPYTEV